MSFPTALPPSITLSRRQRLLACTMGAAGRLLAARPRLMERLLDRAHRKARPSTLAETEHAVLAVTTACLTLGGVTACLPRSLAAALYCRAHGHVPTLVIGIKPGTTQVHAWLEADDVTAGEPSDPHLTYTPVTTY